MLSESKLYQILRDSCSGVPYDNTRILGRCIDIIKYHVGGQNVEYAVFSHQTDKLLVFRSINLKSFKINPIYPFIFFTTFLSISLPFYFLFTFAGYF